MAKIIRFHEFGGPQVLKVDDIDVPEPGVDEVRISIEAIGLNRADVLLRQNQYMETPELPSKLGYDCAATVEAIGEGVTNVAVGDRVLTIPTFSQSQHGVYGEAALVPANSLWPWSEDLAAEHAACVGVQYLTVYFAMREIGKINQGDTVLITAATGGVGFAAIEVAKQMGARIIATTRKQDKATALIEAGADHVVVTSEEDLTSRVDEVTDHKGVNMVFDPIAGKAIPNLLDCLTPGGRLVIYGILDQTEPTIPIMPLLVKGASLHGFSVFSFTGYPSIGIPQQTEAVVKARDFLLPRLADGRLKPMVSETYALEDVIAAHEALESNKQTGKIVLKVK